MKTIITKNVMTLVTMLIFVVFLAVILSLMWDKEYYLPWRLADGWRMITMGLCGLVIGYMSLILKLMWQLKYDPKDDLVVPFGRLMGLFFMLTIFVGLHMFQRQGTHSVSWRTPVAFFVMTLAAYTLHQLYVKFKAAVSKVGEGKFRISVSAVHNLDNPEKPVEVVDLLDK